jgi:hypothetical protein
MQWIDNEPMDAEDYHLSGAARSDAACEEVAERLGLDRAPTDEEMRSFYDRVQDKLADDEGNMREKNDYEVIGVWLDGNPQTLASGLTYPEAVKYHAEKEASKRVLGGVAPFYGIQDADDAERGWGPWEEES